MPGSALTWIAAVCWLCFFAVFYVSHREVRASARGVRPENRVRRERSSDKGMALQFAAVVLALAWPGEARPAMLPVALMIMGAAMGFGRVALKHLGRQWRVQAVVTDDHELITSGPYRIVRHPVYLAFFAMILATALLRGPAWSGGLALLLFAAGTEIRVRAEERILAETFRKEFVAFLTSARWAWLPGIR